MDVSYQLEIAERTCTISIRLISDIIFSMEPNRDKYVTIEKNNSFYNPYLSSDHLLDY